MTAAPEIILYVFVSLFTLLTIFTVYRFWVQRSVESIKYRSPGFTIIGAITIWLLIIIFMLRMNVDWFPCYISLWATSLGYPVIYVVTIIRSIRLWFHYRISEAKFRQALVHVSKQNTVNQSIETAGGSFEMFNMTGKTRNRPDIFSLNEDSFYQKRHILSKRFLAGIFIAVMLAHLLIIVVIQVFSVAYSFKPSVGSESGAICMIGWEYIPHYVISSIYTLIVLPLLIYRMRDVNDAYGIRRELLYTSILMVLSTIILILFLYLPQLHFISTVVSGIVWSAVPLIAIYALMVIRPLVDSYNIVLLKRWSCLFKSKPNLPYTREAMELLLQDPILFNQFKLFSVTDFTLECVLFYECCRNSRFSMDVKELKEIYLNFIHPEAKFQINLSERTKSELEALAHQEKFEPDMYLDASKDIQDLMYVNTFSRYVQHNQNSKAVWEQV
ncbi:hypothetical protein K7432_000956 [Basidiobolus ranarum]|uniref:RGS domain-containing protein n=1 Tax=Basidiobolus ranarum TaxID=34480 RepID=A0ABR2WAE4_9FUNG